MDSQIAENFRRLLAEAKGRNIAVAGHMRPDGDCVSSALSMFEILQAAGANVKCLNKNEVPHLYKNLAQFEFESTETFDPKGWDILLVDCSDLSRVSPALKEKSADVYACIDHHESGNSNAKIMCIDKSAGATAEIIALCATEVGAKISRRAANLLFMGIATDTRQFTTSSTRQESFEAARRLVELGADPNAVAQELYQRERAQKMALLSVYLGTLKRLCQGRVCAGFLRRADFEKTGAQKEDTDGLVDFARSIDGVEIAALLEELEDGSVKGSLRGRTPEYSVNKIAEYFGGGGHLAAAGFTAKNQTFDTILPKFEELCRKSLDKNL